jgi:hypothetical protein
VLLNLLGEGALGYVINRGTNGANVTWSTRISAITIYVDLANVSSENQTQYWGVIQNSITEWNNYSKIKIVPSLRNGNNQSLGNGKNELTFSDNTRWSWGNGVIGMTQLQYSQSSGQIIEADVGINLSMLNLDSSSENYLGNVITHELGHVLGLSHNEVYNSTMFHLSFQGQSTLSADDISGIHAIYPISNTRGYIQGKVVGGQDKIGIFGAYVYAVSAKNGYTTAVISEADGQFQIKGLNPNDIYHLYIRPIFNTQTLPDFYSSAKKDFCSGGAVYRGSFFQTCFAEDIGLPQNIVLTASAPTIDVGNISINCDLDLPQTYLDTKPTVGNIGSDNIIDLGLEKPTLARTGMFTKLETGQTDIYQVNIPPGIGNRKLAIRIFNQYLNAHLKARLKVGDEATILPPILDSDGNNLFDLSTTISLAGREGTSLQIEIREEDSWNASASEDYNDSALYIDPLYFYVLELTLLGEDGEYNNLQANTIYDNTFCPDGPNAYTLSGKTSSTGFRVRKNNDQEIVSCASIGQGPDDNNNIPVNVASFILGLAILGILKLFKEKVHHTLKT